MLLPLAGGSGTVVKFGEFIMILELHRQLRTLSARRLHRYQHGAARRERRRLLQQARHVRAVDQGGQGGDQMDPAVMPFLRRQRRSPSASRTRLQSRQLPAHAGNAGADQDPMGKWIATSALAE
jgi:hypothetical protein